VTMLTPAIRASFAELAEAEFGLRFDGVRRSALDFSISNACRASGLSAEALLARVRSAHESSRQILIDALTVGETYFFREPQHFSWLRSYLVSAVRPVRLWSAGCASGEEPYSMALIARQCLGSACHERVEVWATDLNPLALARARRGVFRPWSFRAMPVGIQARWFREQGNWFSIDVEIKRLVRFRQHNLIAKAVPTVAPLPDAVDIIFCRNVAPYLSPQGLEALAQGLARVLGPEGVIICGSTDPPLRTDLLHMHKSDDIYCYRHASSAPEPASVGPATTRRHILALSSHLNLDKGDWSMAEPPSVPSMHETQAHQDETAPHDPPPDDALERMLRLEPRQRLTDELTDLSRRIDSTPFDADLYLARAQVQQQLGGHGAAIRDARRALMLHSDSIEAHVLIALSAFATRRFSLALRAVRLGRRCSLSHKGLLGREDVPNVLETIERAIHSLRAQ
jgi:chemotaxis protein methyltransferase CheR